MGQPMKVCYPVELTDTRLHVGSSLADSCRAGQAFGRGADALCSITSLTWLQPHEETSTQRQSKDSRWLAKSWIPQSPLPGC